MTKQEILAILNLLKVVQAGLKAMRSSYLGRQNYCVPIEKSEAEIPIRKGATSPSIKFTQFPLILAWASTVHKIQVLSLKQGVADLICESKNHLGQGKHILLSVG